MSSKAFLWPLLSYASPQWCPFLSVTKVIKLEHLYRSGSRAITDCLSSFTNPCLLSKASLSHYESLGLISLCHPMRGPFVCRPPFTVSGLTKLGVKPRFSRSFWRAFASTHPVMPSATSREVLFACPPSPPRKLPSFTVELILYSPCSRSDSPLPRQGVALTHLDTLHLTIWTDGSVFFPLANVTLASCSLCGAETTLSFSAGSFFRVFPLKPAPFYKLSAGASSTNMCVISPLFFFRCVLFLSVLSGYNGSPDTHFSRELRGQQVCQTENAASAIFLFVSFLGVDAYCLI